MSEKPIKAKRWIIRMSVGGYIFYWNSSRAVTEAEVRDKWNDCCAENQLTDADTVEPNWT